MWISSSDRYSNGSVMGIGNTGQSVVVDVVKTVDECELNCLGLDNIILTFDSRLKWWVYMAVPVVLSLSSPSMARHPLFLSAFPAAFV